ncbi:DUF6547 family protein [Vibrio sp. THAF190c]|uniref:DUF6547 family protein n=1 Tax=Vibrio sp. THAF190c TaxID=2587865 RepID=UPI0012690E43|nr:DUF6547 family protein [Vibrio sp. THAF190c]QFT10134.1 hypothetical protein FIV04_09125 [Vibrio sp. THAF190c]
MSKSIEEYKLFIDDMVSLSESAASGWVTGKGFPKVTGNEAKNELLEALTENQKVVLAEIIDTAKASGVHDALSYLNEQQTSNQLRIIKGGTELPTEPFGTEMNFDFVARSEGDDWPKL